MVAVVRGRKEAATVISLSRLVHPGVYEVFDIQVIQYPDVLDFLSDVVYALHTDRGPR